MANIMIPENLPLSPALKSNLVDLKENIAAIGEFRIPRLKATSGGLQRSEDEEPFTNYKGVLIGTRKTRAYYAKAYRPG